MNFTSTDLLPQPYVSPIKRVRYSLPLTPFFIRSASSANSNTRGFHGDDFSLQFKSSGPFIPVPEIEFFCGTAAYRTFTSVDLDEEATHPWTGSLTRSYVFNTENNTVSVQAAVVGRPTIGNIWPDSPTTATQGATDNDPPDHTTITLSEPVDKDWLMDELQRWMDESDDFRDATGGGLGTYSYIGQGATRSESDGYLGIVGGGDVVAFGPWFTGTPHSMIGDEGDFWNGNFSTWVSRVRRKNAPILHRENSKKGTLVSGADWNMEVGKAIYRAGYSELALSDPIGDLWMDEYGVFPISEALEDFPKSASFGGDFGNLLYYTGEGQDNELTLISRTGKRYRVTIQSGHYDYQYDENDWEAEPTVTWITAQSYVLTTDASLQATASIEAHDDASQIRVSLIEQEIIIDDQPQWQVVADADEGQQPETLIGSNVIFSGYLLLAAIKTRRGSRFGFYPLVYLQETANDRYRKQTFQLHLTPGTVEAYDGECGLGEFSGSADLEWSEEYDAQTGEQLPRVVGQWNLNINGVDWTQESYSNFDTVFFNGSTSAVQTATKIRRIGSHTWKGRFLVAHDAPDPNGKILSNDWIKISMNVSDDRNKTASVLLDPPASGESRFFEGHRLTYSGE